MRATPALASALEARHLIRMTKLIAALPMYDFAEARAETDAAWAVIRDRLRAGGIDAPEALVRRNADMPAVAGGIRGDDGAVIAPDPATLPPDELDFPTLWRHPALLFCQTCWGPLELGLERDVTVVAQPDYSAFEGGAGPLYSSVIVMRPGEGAVAAPSADGTALLPLDLMRGRRLAYNSDDSMSGIIALTRDLAAAGETLGLFAERLETGAHRASIVAVAEERADVCAVDCRTWDLCRRFEPAAREVVAVGWTARRKGLPYIMAKPLVGLLPQVRAAVTAL